MSRKHIVVSLVVVAACAVAADYNTHHPPHDTTTAHSHHHDVLNLAVFFEGLDGHSKQFFSGQLEPTLLKLRQKIKVELVPYGKAHESHSVGIACEHGEQECEMNKFIACGLEMLHSDEDKVKFTSCVMNKGADILSHPGCDQTVHLNYNKVKLCGQGPKGTELLKKMAELTPAAIAERGLPMLEIDGKWDKHDQRDMLTDFYKFACKYLDYPHGCEHARKAEIPKL